MNNVNVFIISYTRDLLLCVSVLSLTLILLRSVRYRKSLQESWYIFHKLCDVYDLDHRDRGMISMLLKRLSVIQPHTFISSIHFFEDYFVRLMVLVDKSKKLYKLKADLLCIYTRIRDKLITIPLWKPERRIMPRFRNVEPLYVQKNKKKAPHEGLLLNISGGGIRFFTKHAFKKGSHVNISFEHDFVTTVTARVLDVMERNDFFLIRAKYSFAYPKSC